MTAIYSTYQVKLAKAAEYEFITLKEVKLYLRLENEQEDMLISNFITAAINAAEKFIGACITYRSFQIEFIQAVFNKFFFPHAPIATITMVKCDHKIQKYDYQIVHRNRAVQFSKTLRGKSVVIDYDSGLNLDQQQLALIKVGLLQHIDQMYHFRSANHLLPTMSINCYLPFRQNQV